MQTRPLFLRTSGSSGVPKGLLLERNGQLSWPKKKKNKTLASSHRPYPSINGVDSTLLKLLHKPATRAMEWVRRILLSHILILQKESTTSHAATGKLSVEIEGMSLTVNLGATDVANLTVSITHHMTVLRGVILMTDVPALCVARLVTLPEIVLQDC